MVAVVVTRAEAIVSITSVMTVARCYSRIVCLLVA